MKPRIYKYKGKNPKKLIRPWRLLINRFVYAKLVTHSEALDCLEDYLLYREVYF